jgi:serine/threonine-protein kinase
MNTGQTLGDYGIIRPLGKGGMGEVYLAEDTRLKREVAIKVLPESVSTVVENWSKEFEGRE